LVKLVVDGTCVVHVNAPAEVMSHIVIEPSWSIA
jgi:hypothetical protein